jgi:hypothetical protein
VIVRYSAPRDQQLFETLQQVPWFRHESPQGISCPGHTEETDRETLISHFRFPLQQIEQLWFSGLA